MLQIYVKKYMNFIFKSSVFHSGLYGTTLTMPFIFASIFFDPAVPVDYLNQ